MSYNSALLIERDKAGVFLSYLYPIYLLFLLLGCCFRKHTPRLGACTAQLELSSAFMPGLRGNCSTKIILRLTPAFDSFWDVPFGWEKTTVRSEPWGDGLPLCWPHYWTYALLANPSVLIFGRCNFDIWTDWKILAFFI